MARAKNTCWLTEGCDEKQAQWVPRELFEGWAHKEARSRRAGGTPLPTPGTAFRSPLRDGAVGLKGPAGRGGGSAAMVCTAWAELPASLTAGFSSVEQGKP